MTYVDSVTHLFAPADELAETRAARLRQLGLGGRPEPEFDEFAQQLAADAKAKLAMVNFIGTDRQYFAGLFAPALLPEPEAATDPNHPARTMTTDQGWCPHVVARGKALVLRDVCDFPRFAGNEVIDLFGIRSYIGAPVFDKTTGLALGTVCIVDTTIRPWGKGGEVGLEFIKDRAAQITEFLSRRRH